MFSRAYTQDFLLKPDYAGVTLRVATNYQIFGDPLSTPLDVPNFFVSTSIPVSINRWDPDINGFLPEDYFGLNPSMYSTVTLGFKNATSVGVSFPFMLGTLTQKYGFRGAVSAFKTQNLDFDLNVDVANLEVLTNGLGGEAGEEEDVKVKLKALVNSPTSYSMQWETFGFGYIFSPSKLLKISAQLQRHTFKLKTDDLVNIDMYGYVDYNGLRSNIEYNLPDRVGDEVYMNAIGVYEGSKWIPQFALEASKLSFVFRPGATVDLKGKFNMGFSLPFFFNVDSLLANGFDDQSIIDQDLLLKSPARIGSGEVTSRGYTTTQKAEGKIPTSFSIGVDVYKKYFNLSWTHFTDAFVLNHINGQNSQYFIDGELAPDSSQYVGKENFYLYVKISNIFMLSGEYSYFDYTLGYMDMSIRKKRGEKFQENLPIPILGLGARTKTKYELYTKIYVSPIPSIVGGFRLNL